MGAPQPMEPTMTTVESRVPTESKRRKTATTAKSEKRKATEKRSSKHAAARKLESSDDLHAAHITKHDRILTLLRQRDGATITEMMEISGWQQHSVRGFLAGTIKKKLGLALTSSKAAGEMRRYRIDTKRGR